VVDHNAMLICAAIEGKGITCVPEFWAKEYVAAGTLQPVLEPETANELVVSAVWPSGCYPPKLKAFVDFMAKELPPVLGRGERPISRADPGAASYNGPEANTHVARSNGPSTGAS
jgi:hypothetical protein